MADDPKKTGSQDRLRINVHETHEVAYWTKALGVSHEELVDLVKQHGVMAADIRRALGKRD